MIKQLLIVAFFPAFLIVSCDPSIRVEITNRSAGARQVKVNCPGDFGFPPGRLIRNNDSIVVFRLNTVYYKRDYSLQPLVSRDTNARSYTFELNPGYGAIVERHGLAPVPTYGQVFIIDNTDTVVLKRHGKSFVKSGGMLLAGGGVWTYTIKK